MENDSTKDRFSRRGFLGIGSAALATVAGSLVFDQGLFSEDNTFLLSDRVAHTPPDVLSKNFGLAERALTALPTGSLYIFPADLPRSLAEDKAAVGGPKVQSPIQYTFKMEAMAPTKRTSGGEIRIVDSHNFPAARNIAAASNIIKACASSIGIRTLLSGSSLLRGRGA